MKVGQTFKKGRTRFKVKAIYGLGIVSAYYLTSKGARIPAGRNILGDKAYKIAVINTSNIKTKATKKRKK